jgi:hypothetical protein
MVMIGARPDLSTCTAWRGAVSMDILEKNAAAEATTAAEATVRIVIQLWLKV